MQEGSLRIRVDRNLSYGMKTIGLYADCRNDDGRFVRGKFEWQSVPEGEQFAPAGILCETSAQILMDELWNCGIRPTEGSGSAGSLSATEKHLLDMRRIAFDKLGIKNHSEVIDK